MNYFKLLSPFCIIAICFGSAFAQIGNFDLEQRKKAMEENPVELPAHTRFGASITAEEFKTDLAIFASDEFAGREAGYEGEEKARKFLDQAFSKAGVGGVNGKRFQDFYLLEKTWDGVQITANGSELEWKKDFYAFLGSNSEVNLKTEEIVFVGYGIEDENYSDYTKVDVKGKVVLAYKGEPKNKEGKYKISQSTKASKWTSNWREKLKMAKEKGAAAILIIDEKCRETIPRIEHWIDRPQTQLFSESTSESPYAPALYISEFAALQITKNAKTSIGKLKQKIDKRGKPRSKKLNTQLELSIKFKSSKLKAENVLAFIEGSSHKDEVIVFTAHYDHLGVHDGKIYNGADDNGSGTLALVEIAEAFQMAKEAGFPTKRSLLFLPVSAEEKGLLGSKFYAENPVIPMEKTVACLNVDMIGRVDSAHDVEGKRDYIYIIGSNFMSRDLHRENLYANTQNTKLDLDFRYNREDDPNRFYYRSDHYNFVKKGVPSIFYFSGITPDYHKETDTEEKCDYDLMAKRAQLIFHTGWRLANRIDPLKID